MKKVIAVAFVAVLVVGSSAIGQIQQGQNWNLGLTDQLSLMGGSSTASTIQGIGTLNVQALGINPTGDPADPYLASAGEGIGAALFQTGSATTGGAPVGLVQTLAITGGTMNGQQQLVGDLAGPATEVESVGVNGGQTLTKGIGSPANVNGLNLVGFGMGQVMENACAEGGQLSLILGGQYSEIDGQAQAVANVATTMCASVVQVQGANSPEP